MNKSPNCSCLRPANQVCELEAVVERYKAALEKIAVDRTYWIRDGVTVTAASMTAKEALNTPTQQPEGE